MHYDSAGEACHRLDVGKDPDIRKGAEIMACFLIVFLLFSNAGHVGLARVRVDETWHELPVRKVNLASRADRCPLVQAMFSMRCKNAKAFATMTVQRACSNATLSIMPVCGLPLLSTAPRHLCTLANRPAPSPTCQPALATAILMHPRRRTKESLCSHGTCGITDNEPCRCQRRVRCHRRMPCLEGG
jgi:hypothetical protein